MKGDVTMKKSLSMILTLCLFLSTICITVSGSGYVENTYSPAENSSNNSLVEYQSADRTYTVFIPTKIVLHDIKDGTSIGEDFFVELYDIFLAQNEQLSMTLSPMTIAGATKDNFNLELTTDSSVTIDNVSVKLLEGASYTISDGQPVIDTSSATESTTVTPGSEINRAGFSSESNGFPDSAAFLRVQTPKSNILYPGTYQVKFMFTVTLIS